MKRVAHSLTVGPWYLQTHHNLLSSQLQTTSSLSIDTHTHKTGNGHKHWTSGMPRRGSTVTIQIPFNHIMSNATQWHTALTWTLFRV